MKELHNRNFGIAFTILAFFTYTCGNEDQSIHAFLKERLTGSFYSAMFTSDEKRQIYHLKISGEADTRQVLELLKTRGFEIQGKGDALVFLYEKRISKTGGDEVIDSIIDSDIYFTLKRDGKKYFNIKSLIDSAAMEEFLIRKLSCRKIQLSDQLID